MQQKRMHRGSGLLDLFIWLMYTTDDSGPKQAHQPSSLWCNTLCANKAARSVQTLVKPCMSRRPRQGSLQCVPMCITKAHKP